MPQNMDKAEVGALVLAAGKGTRMRSQRPKVLQPMLGEPMLWYVLHALLRGYENRVWTVIGHEADAVRAAFPEEKFVLQKEQRGTGHALQTAWAVLRDAGLDHVLVLNGDTPLVPKAEVERLVGEHLESNADLTFMTMQMDPPGSYGRVVRSISGRVQGVVEAKDLHGLPGGKAITEVNAGMYVLRLSTLEPLVFSLTSDNAQNELYLTDLVGMADKKGLRVHTASAEDNALLAGVNTPAELVALEERIRADIVHSLLETGVIIHNPSQVWIGPRVRIEPGCRIIGPCHILGETHIAETAVIEPYCYVMDSRLRGCQVRAFTHIEESEVVAGCVVGPYARLRPGARIQAKAKVGNFVEIKQTTLGPGSKAGHLSYLGECMVGADVNIGAGTITCNYDGRAKHETKIRDGAFIGSNTALVAPVTIGARSLVGAGSTITKDVPDSALAIARAKQKNLHRLKE